MYQIVINNEYYVSDVDIGARHIDGSCLVFGFETIKNKYDAKFFEYEEEAQSIAEQIGGKAIEYVEKKDIQVEVKCNVELNDIVKQLGCVKIK